MAPSRVHCVVCVERRAPTGWMSSQHGLESRVTILVPYIESRVTIVVPYIDSRVN